MCVGFHWVLTHSNGFRALPYDIGKTAFQVRLTVGPMDK